MASPSTTAADLAGNFKRIYGDKFQKIKLPEAKFQQEIPFEDSEKPGEDYREAARMTEEHGFTIRASTTLTSDSPLNDPISMKVEPIVAAHSIIDFVSRIDIDAIHKALSGGKQAFKDHVGLRVEGMRDAMSRQVEWSMLYGGLPLGTVTAISGSSTSRVLTVSAATWAGGWWAGTENMPMNLIATATGTVAINTNAKLQVTSYDLSARTITVSCNSSDGTLMDTAVGSAACYLFRRGGSAASEVPGLVKLLQTTAGTVHGIVQATYPIFTSTQHAVGTAPLTMAHLLQADAKSAERGGFARKPKKVWLSSRNFAVLNTDLGTGRRYDGSYSRTKATNGFQAIEFLSPTSVLEIEVHPYMKDGDAIMFDPSTVTRRGTTDITFEYMGADMFTLVPQYQQYEYRGYSAQGPFCNRLNSNTYISGITVPT